MRWASTLPKPRLILVGEPTTMTVVDAHKGGYRFFTEITGKDAHSSKPQLGVGAIMVAGELIAELARIEQRLKATHSDPRFDPPYNSITVSMIEGGIAHNIIPPRCAFQWGVRALPGLDALDIMRELDAYAARELLPKMRAVAPQCDIVTKNLGILPAFTTGNNAEATSLALKLMGQNETFAVPYGTEASALPGGRLLVRHLRPRRHRPGAPAQRVRGDRRARQVPGLSPPPRRLGRGGLRHRCCALATRASRARFAPRQRAVRQNGIDWRSKSKSAEWRSA